MSWLERLKTLLKARFGSSKMEDDQAFGNPPREASVAKLFDMTLHARPRSPDPIPPTNEPPPGSTNVRTATREAPKLRSNWLHWPVERLARTFRVYVVEPREYSPGKHGEIFSAALTSLVTPESSHIDPFARKMATGTPERFDLVTFPEAFLPTDELLLVLNQLSALASFGCVHVGLRPSVADSQHLFSTDELQQLLDSLIRIPQIVTEDLTPFSEWLASQSPAGRFNVGCLFTIDAQQHVRVCLHPKLVRSKYEISTLHEGHMTEADLLTLVTLQPEDSTLLSIILQPLICADALFLDTDSPHCRPLEAVTAHAECFGRTPPDHVDVVSVATCTPQPEPEIPGLGPCRQWHQEFRNSFLRTASDAALARHHYATFVLSNFLEIRGNTGGLSGAFLPIPLRYGEYPPFVTVSAWGRSSPHSDNSWSPPVTNPPSGREWSSFGYVAALAPADDSSLALARMFGFTIQRLPRHMTRWGGNTNGLIDCQLRSAISEADSGKVVFRREVQ